MLCYVCFVTIRNSWREREGAGWTRSRLDLLGMAHDWGGCPSLARSDSWVGVGAGEGAIRAAFSEATWESMDVRACRNSAGKTGRFPLGLI